MRSLHQTLAWVVVGANAFVGVWCLAAEKVEALRVRPMWWAVVAAQLTVFAQVILGVILRNTENIDPGGMHMLYGFSGIFAVGIIYSYKHQMERYRYLLYGGGSLFIMGLGLRAISVYGLGAH